MEVSLEVRLEGLCMLEHSNRRARGRHRGRKSGHRLRTHEEQEATNTAERNKDGMREYLVGSPLGKKRWYEGNPRETEEREPHAAAGKHTTATKHTNRRPEGPKRARVVCRAQANTNKVWQKSTSPNPPQQSPRE